MSIVSRMLATIKKIKIFSFSSLVFISKKVII
nr:MAG TPA: hypothetical protein [Caudoviricetes sp.]